MRKCSYGRCTSRDAGGWLTLPRRAAARASCVPFTGATLRIQPAFSVVLLRLAADIVAFVVLRYRSAAGQRCLLGTARIAARISEPRSTALVRVRRFVHVGSSRDIPPRTHRVLLHFFSFARLRVRIPFSVFAAAIVVLVFGDGTVFLVSNTDAALPGAHHGRRNPPLHCCQMA